MAKESTVKIFQEINLRTGEIIKENRLYNFENSYTAFDELGKYICYLSDKDPSAIRVLMLLINEASQENSVFITQEEIANRLNKSLILIKKCVRSLIQNNAIRVIPSIGDKRRNIIAINGNLVWKGNHSKLHKYGFIEALSYQSIL